MQAVTGALPPDSGVDRIDSALRSGFSIGVNKSYETRLQVGDARTGAVLGTSTTWNW